jgi:cyanate permease
MNLEKFYRICLWIALTSSLLGVIFNIFHYPLVSMLLFIGIISTLIVIVLGLIDVFTNDRLISAERIMWMVGFIFLTGIVGFIYYPKYKMNNKSQYPTYPTSN